MNEEYESNQHASFENGSLGEDYGDYLERAVRASDSGNKTQAIMFYLIAFDKARMGNDPSIALPDAHPTIEGLQNAWLMAVEMGERAVAEYIFEQLDPYLSPEEMELCSFQLQRLALSKLREFGLSMQDVEAVSSMLHDDMVMNSPFGGMKITVNDNGVAAVEALAFEGSSPENTESAAEAIAEAVFESLAPIEGDIDDAQADAVAEVLAEVADEIEADADASDDAETQVDAAAEVEQPKPAKPAVPEIPMIPRSMAEELAHRIGALPRSAAVGQSSGQITAAGKSQELTRGNEATEPVAGHRGYGDLVGYDEAIKKMRERGFGMKNDEDFKSLLSELSESHGIEKLPSYGTLLFRAFAREDATRLMLATAYELDMPTVRMYMDENAQGVPILCVIASPDFRTRANVGFNGSVESGVLILEDVDLWAVPFQETSPEDNGQFPMQQLSHGVRKAIGLIRSAVDNPNVTVLASCSTENPMESFMLDLLNPESVMDVELPTADERMQMWEYLANKHHSLNSIDKKLLVKFSSNMSRYDIFYAAREAVEQAYKESIMKRTYVSVSPEDMAEKLAAFQPLTSREYHALEDAVVASFRGDIEELEKLLGNE